MPDAPSDLPITGRYRFALADYLALTKAMQPANRSRRYLIIPLWLAVMVVIIGLSSGSWEQFFDALRDLVQFRDVPPFIYVLLAIGPAVIILSPLLQQWQARRVYKWNATAELDVALEIDLAGIRSSSPGRHSSMDWSVVRGVRRTEEHIFLILSRREALVLPRRAFADAKAFDAIEELARQGMVATANQ